MPSTCNPCKGHGGWVRLSEDVKDSLKVGQKIQGRDQTKLWHASLHISNSSSGCWTFWYLCIENPFCWSCKWCVSVCTCCTRENLKKVELLICHSLFIVCSKRDPQPPLSWIKSHYSKVRFKMWRLQIYHKCVIIWSNRICCKPAFGRSQHVQLLKMSKFYFQDWR